ncbi:lytic transglycosylase domain-containing protein [Commensalibacter oyaizuii]|uniref:Lytic transglycosylase domain-containing protein n=1 Tax=Commensalibacter oyaizuii TaxID=3043873 RepID=A0ABT6PZV5_9PROT|nr:lytic transglycosylase domain-containing protein [Commensalibacter sp. TBRC 16381]MDI2090250.1 lytic transglycosylase domain-containing protein [Commensalibacter sp. TBRC 16381]
MYARSFFSFTTILTTLAISTVGCSQSNPVRSQPVIQHTDVSSGSGDEINQNDSDNVGLSANASVQDKVNLYLQLLRPSGGTAAIYAQFLTENPDWPNRSVFLKRMQDALILETDKKVITNICQTQPLTSAAALSFCAQQDKQDSNLVQKARNAWINTVSKPADEQELLKSFSEFFTNADQWERFNRLEAYGLLSAASRQVQYLTAAEQRLALAILAFRKNVASAEDQLSGLDKKQLKDPGLVYARLRWLRLQNRNDEAFKLWQTTGFQIERNSTQKRFWVERDHLIRSFLTNGDNKSAYALAATNACNTNICEYDSAFLAGWINLRKLNKPSEAIGHFQTLTHASSVLTTSRGYYWLGRAYQALNKHSYAQQAWEQAAQLPTTFYGQLAIAELQGINKQSVILNPSLLSAAIQQYLANVQEPVWSNSQIKLFKDKELVQAAQILVQQSDYNHARPFLLAVNKNDNDNTTQAINAQVSNELGLPDDAVAIARNAGSKGIILLKNGWPRPYTPPASNLPKGLALGIMRQESSFNPLIVSPSRAYGLMQLLPSTAREVAVQIGLPAKMGNPGNLVVPQNNMKLGTAYLEKLMGRFNNTIPYAVAGYNGGPNRVKQWIINNDPTANAASQDEIIDWIEQIPYSETRNYVQRVIENTVIYQTDIY